MTRSPFDRSSVHARAARWSVPASVQSAISARSCSTSSKDFLRRAVSSARSQRTRNSTVMRVTVVRSRSRGEMKGAGTKPINGEQKRNRRLACATAPS